MGTVREDAGCEGCVAAKWEKRRTQSRQVSKWMNQIFICPPSAFFIGFS